MTHIDDAKRFPCTAIVGNDQWEWLCGAMPGQDCHGRLDTDSNWVHTERTELALHNAQLVLRQNRIEEILRNARQDVG